MFEIIVLCTLQAFLILWERFKQKPRLLVFRPSDDNPFKNGLVNAKGISKGAIKIMKGRAMHGSFSEEDGLGVSDDGSGGLWPLAEK